MDKILPELEEMRTDRARSRLLHFWTPPEGSPGGALLRVSRGSPGGSPKGPQEGPRWAPEVEKTCGFLGERVSLTRFPQNTRENTARAMPRAAQTGVEGGPAKAQGHREKCPSSTRKSAEA